jgi:cell shape-determining protein MreC
MKYRSGKSRSGSRYINGVLGMLAFLLFIYYWPLFRGVVYPIVEPLVRGYGGSKSTIHIVPEFIAVYFSSRNALIEKNHALELAVERLENGVAQQDAILREQALIADVQSPGSTAPVIVLYPLAEDITKLYSTIILSKGFKDGIEKGGIVYIRGLQPVCEITEVYDRTSQCELLSKGNRETQAVTGSSTIMLTLKGEGGGSFIAETPKGTLVSVGEDVYLRSNPAYKLGTVVSVQDDEQATGATVYVRGAYNPVHSSVMYVHARYAP